jgi:hypothetical protein
LKRRDASSIRPAVRHFVWRFASGTTEEMYYREGRLHREDGPADVWRSVDGLTTVEKYYREGRLHREDGPALVWCYANGSTMEQYYRNGELHREDGPAVVKRYANVLSQKFAYKSGRRFPGWHRPS